MHVLLVRMALVVLLGQSKSKGIAGASLLLILIMLGVLIAIPEPSKTQDLGFVAILAVAITGFLSSVEGSLAMKLPTEIKAGGIVAILILILYFMLR